MKRCLDRLSADVKLAGTVKTALDVLLGLIALVVVGYLALMLLAMYWARLGGGTPGNHIGEHRHFASQFRAGDTNAPLLAMDWFSDHGLHFCCLSQSGNVRSARDVGHACRCKCRLAKGALGQVVRNITPLWMWAEI
jgi:hypothetical protein